MRYIITLTIISLLPLFAQEDFLKGVRAEDLILERIEAPSVEDTIGISNWSKYFFNSANLQIGKDNKMEVVVIDNGILVNDYEKKVKYHIDDRGFMPQLSPDGSLIAFLKQRVLVGQYYKGRQLYGSEEIWICEPDGNNKLNLMPGVDVGEFQWCPDGKHIAFNYRNEEHGKWALGIVDIETKEKKFLDDYSPYDEAGFSFSPDGQMIAYCKPLKWEWLSDWYTTDAEVFIINRDGSGKTQITETKAVENMVKWHKNGKKLIVWQSSPDPSDFSYPEYVTIILKKKK